MWFWIQVIQMDPVPATTNWWKSGHCWAWGDNCLKVEERTPIFHRPWVMLAAAGLEEIQEHTRVVCEMLISNHDGKSEDIKQDTRLNLQWGMLLNVGYIAVMVPGAVSSMWVECKRDWMWVIFHALTRTAARYAGQLSLGQSNKFR